MMTMVRWKFEHTTRFAIHARTLFPHFWRRRKKKSYFYFAGKKIYWCCCCERTLAHWVDAFVQPQKAMIALNSQCTASAQHSPLDARETREKKKYINSQQVTCASSSILIVPANIFHIHTHTYIQAQRLLTASHLWIEVEQTTTKLPNENSNRIHTHGMASNVYGADGVRHVCCLISECFYAVCMTGECHQRHKSLECTHTHTYTWKKLWFKLNRMCAWQTMSWIMYE